MRLGKKKEKESEPKCQMVEGICRLVCSYKATQAPIKGRNLKHHQHHYVRFSFAHLISFFSSEH